MLRMYRISRRNIRPPLLRRALSSSGRNPENSTDALNNLKISQNVPLPPAVHHQSYHPATLSSSSSSSALLSKTSIVAALSATLLVASYALIPTQDDTFSGPSNRKSYLLYKEIENAIEKSNESFNKILNRMKQTGVAASVLWQSLRSVMSSANHEVRAGFELRVAALLADIVAASDNRRAAIVEAGGG
ncbi:alpha/beta-Hydrolases superfamily protein [Abeliophyllum distichum]|uniref:Alpha/beta-Hydrolases superfamily protein n=1 Tax=Abeliophyllum distichum TaxID=126358 RepID=A0ABD1TJ37_9LAMI